MYDAVGFLFTACIATLLHMWVTSLISVSLLILSLFRRSGGNALVLNRECIRNVQHKNVEYFLKNPIVSYFIEHTIHDYAFVILSPNSRDTRTRSCNRETKITHTLYIQNSNKLIHM